MDFLQKQQDRFNVLMNGLTPSQKRYYESRLNRIQRNITLNQYKSTLPDTVESKKKVNDKRKDMLGDKLLDVKKVNEIAKQVASGDLSGVLTGKHHAANVFNAIQRSVKANISDIPEAVANKAIMTRAGTIFARQGKSDAEGYLSQMGVEGVEILPESTSEGLVLRDASGKVKVAFRGTMIPSEFNEISTSAGDIGTDLAFMVGVESQTPQFTRADKMVADAKAKYGANFDEILGYSLGAGKSHILGDKYGIDTTTFNPLIGKNFVNTGETSSQHNIYRTTEDIPSLGSGLITRGNSKVNSIYPLKSNMFNIKRHHDLENFIQRGKKRVTESHINNLMESSVDMGAKMGSIRTMSDMANYIDKIEDTRPPMPRFGQAGSDELKARFAAFEEPNFTYMIRVMVLGLILTPKGRCYQLCV